MTAHNPDTREKLLELAERCEKATGPDRELDMLIDCALKGIEVVYPTEGHPMTPGRGGRIEAKGTFELLGWIDPGEVQRNFSPYGGEDRYPNVTTSLDAAMTISPVTRQVDVLLDAISACQGDEDGWLRDLPRFVCAAALRARNEQVTI